MSKNTSSVNGGAMSKADRTQIMVRAWAIFRETYNYPRIRFSSIGRTCFNSCLRAAWTEWRQAQAVKTIPAKEKRARIKVLQRQITRAQYADNYRTTQQIESACRAEIALLSGKGVARIVR